MGVGVDSVARALALQGSFRLSAGSPALLSDFTTTNPLVIDTDHVPYALIGGVVTSLRARYRPVYLEDYGGDGDNGGDNVAALAAASAAFPYATIMLRGGKTYNFDHITLPQWTSIEGGGMWSTTIMITGDGGGAPAVGANGGVRLFSTANRIANLQIKYSNPALQCLVNVSNGGAKRFYNVSMQPGPNLTTSQIIAKGLWISSEDDDQFISCNITRFSQDVLVAGTANAVHFITTAFGFHTRDYPNGVFNDRNPMVQWSGTGQGSSINSCTFETGPNMLKIDTPNGVLTVTKNYFGDATILATYGFWLPNTAFAQGKITYPSGSTTGTIAASSTALTLGSGANAYVGQRIVIIGAGASGANLQTWITALNGTAVTVHDAASTTVSGAAVYYGLYAGHGYLASVGGTTGSTPPAFPTGAAATVTDGTVTWMEYGTCADIDASGANLVHVGPGNFIENNVVGVYASRADGFGFVNVKDNYFTAGPHYCVWSESIGRINIEDNYINQYNNVGYWIQATNHATKIKVSGNRNIQSANGADVVIGPVSSGITGIHDGETLLVAVGGSTPTIFNNQQSPTAQMLLPGSLSIGLGTPLTKDAVYTPTLTPASVAAQITAEQTFSVLGLTTADKVIVNGPAPTAGTGIVNARVSAADTLALAFINTTGGPLTPASGIYTVLAFRS